MNKFPWSCLSYYIQYLEIQFMVLSLIKQYKIIYYIRKYAYLDSMNEISLLKITTVQLPGLQKIVQDLETLPFHSPRFDSASTHLIIVSPQSTEPEWP